MNKNFVIQYPGIQADYDLVFADTEFSRLPYPAEAMVDWATRVTLLSIGLVGLENTSAYADFYGHRSLNKTILTGCDSFVLSDVIPHLEIVEFGMSFSNLVQLKRMLIRFLSGRRRLSGKAPLICVDWPGDAMLLGALLGHSRYMLLNDVPEINNAMSNFFAEGYVRHNSLHDALAIRRGYIDLLSNELVRGSK